MQLCCFLSGRKTERLSSNTECQAKARCVYIYIQVDCICMAFTFMGDICIYIYMAVGEITLT